MIHSCPKNTYRCNYGACVARDARCNGVINCADNSDELYCDSESECNNQFRCQSISDECVSYFSLCNGKIKYSFLDQFEWFFSIF